MNRLGRGGAYTRLAAAFVLLALALRLGAVAVVDFHPVNDPEDYINMGESIAHDARFPDSTYAEGPTATRAPLYPIVLGGVFKLTGDSVTAARVFGALLGTLVALLTGLLAARLWNRRVGVIALGLAAVAPPLVLISVTLMTETLFTALALGSLLLILRVRERPSEPLTVMAGVLAALAMLARPNGAIMILAALIGLWGTPWRSLRALARPAWALVAAALVLTPWTVRNALELDAFVPVTTSGWITASGMFNDTTMNDPRYPAAWRVPNADPELAEIIRQHSSEGEVALGEQLRAHTREYIADNPGSVVEAEVRNLLRFAHLQDFDLTRSSWRSVGLEAWPAPIANVFFMVLLALAVGGVIAGGLRAGPWWLWVVPVLLVGSVALVGTGVRYRLPVDPFVILLAAYALHRLWPGGEDDAAPRGAGTVRRDTAGEPEDEPSLRVTTARGTIINAAFQIGLSGLGLLRRLAVAAFLTTAEYGIWGIVLAVLITLVWLKQIGIQDKYVQQREADQELAFQRAFTIELGLSAVYCLIAAIALPLYALAYGNSEIIAPGLVLTTAVILTALQTPAWIAYRRLDYVRHRVLTAVDPVVSIVATIALGAAGFGYWGLVVGALIGSVAGAVVCVAWSPYRLRLRFDRATARSYASFSWPLVALGLSNLLMVQGVLLVANHSVGLGAVGIIGLVTGIAAFANSADGIVSQTIYPAVCRVADRTQRLREVFVKSNRVALMWAMPFAAGVALFAGDFVHFVLGPGWNGAIDVLAMVALSCGFGQIAFNWSVFMRALGRTRPLFVAALINAVVFLGVSVPAIIVLGINGYGIAFAVSTAVQIAVRAHYMRRLLGGFSVLRQTARAVAPVLPATLVILGIRLATSGPESLAVTALEVLTFAVLAVGGTIALERSLLTELLGYLRGRNRAVPPVVPA